MLDRVYESSIQATLVYFSLIVPGYLRLGVFRLSHSSGLVFSVERQDISLQGVAALCPSIISVPEYRCLLIFL